MIADKRLESLRMDFSDFIRLWRKKGLSWQQIADNLELEFNIFTSAQVLEEDFGLDA